jgi:hypothetical protein
MPLPHKNELNIKRWRDIVWNTALKKTSKPTFFNVLPISQYCWRFHDYKWIQKIKTTCMQQNVWPHHIGMTPHQEENVI